MLDISFIRRNTELVKENSRLRGISVDIDQLLALDEDRRRLQNQIDTTRSELKKNSKSKPDESQIASLRSLGETIKELEARLEVVSAGYKQLLDKVPNLTHPDSPTGGVDDFKVVYSNREPAVFAFKPKSHEQILSDLDLIDFERGAKVAASKFYFAKGDLVRFNLALINYGIDVVSKHGYRLLETPDVAKNEILVGIGFAPRGPETQVYSLEATDLSLIGTAEVTVGGYHADEVLDLSQGPKKYVALSHCFRTEAGAYGRTNAGLYRVHQFTKLEMFVYCQPSDSEAMHEELLAIEKEICDGLGLSYRVIDIASGDLGGPAYRKYDIEAWMTTRGQKGDQGGYGEITSTSNCTDYQARRLNTKYRKPDNTTEHVHTLNGTAVVTSRFPIAVFEQNQQADGTVKIPEVLRKHMGKDYIK